MITAAIVLFNEQLETLKLTVDSFLKTPLEKKLYLVDNSPVNDLEAHFKHSEITYIFVGKNIGFGAAHNLVIDAIKDSSRFHLILNPDVCFNAAIFQNLFSELEKKSNVAMISPSVVYPNGDVQVICRKNPSLKALIGRRLGIFKSYLASRQYQDVSVPFYPDFMHGCFMLFKTADFVNIRGFDERFFLYMEDADICRKLKMSGKEILYYPKEQITHVHRRGSSKNIKLFYFHVVSAIRYFRKWRK